MRGVQIALTLTAGWLLLGAVAAQAADDLLDLTRARQEVAAQKLEADVREAIASAQKVQRTDPAKALAYYKWALDRIQDDYSVDETRRTSLRRLVNDQRKLTEAGIRTMDDVEVQKIQREIAQSARRAEQQRMAAEDEKVRQELKQIQNLWADGRMKEASSAASDLARRYPTSPYATAARYTTSTATQLTDARALENERNRRFILVQSDVLKSSMPPLGDIEFPPDWAEKSKRREKIVNRMTERERAILKALNTPITVNFKDTPFEQVIKELERVSGVPFALDPQSLKEAGVGYDTPVSLQARNLTLRTILKKILGDLQLAYIVKQEAIQVMTPELAARETTIREYYLGDLIANFDPRLPPALNAYQMYQNVGYLINLIKTTIEPDSWQERNGPGTIVFDPAGMRLIVKQSAEVHFVLGSGLR